MYSLNRKDFTTPVGKSRNFTFRSDTNDENIIRAAFCEDEYKLLNLNLKEKDIILDIGAHLGAVTLMLTTLRPDLRIFAFEPIKENFKLLKENVEKIDYDGEINIFNEAVWFYDDDEVKMYFGVKGADDGGHKFIGSQFLIHGLYNKKVFRRVPSVSLSEIFKDNHIFNCRFAKIDCEGGEYGILKGAPKEVLEMIQEIRGEYHNISPQKIKKPRQTLLDQTKGVFEDVTGFPEKGNIGPFIFRRK